MPLPEQTASESELITSARQGNLEAFNQLISLYQDSVFNTAFRVLGGYDEAEDAAQKAFISAYRGLQSFRGGSFRAWLLRTTINACYDQIRRAKRHPEISMDADPLDDDHLGMDYGYPDPSPSPHQMMETRELQQAVQHCLQELPEEFRIVAVLADVEELDYEEISRVTANPLGTVKSRLARARQKLRGCLEDFWELLPLNLRQKYEGAG